MTNNAKTGPAVPKRRKWLKVLGWTLGVVVVLVVFAYFTATSSGFLRQVILPKVSKSLGADVTVEDASIHPFSEVLLRHLKVAAPGAAPVLTADEVRARYSLWDIIRGNIKVDEVAVVAPTITIIEQSNGTRNIDVFLNQQKPSTPAQPKPSTPSKNAAPPKIDIGKIALTEATIRYVKQAADGAESSAEISGVNLEIDNVKNGATGKLSLNAGIAMNNKVPAPGTNSAAQAKLTAGFDFALANDLQPSSVKGNLSVDVSQAQGVLAALAALAVRLDCEVTPTDIKQVVLAFQQGGAPLGEIRVSGPFDSSKTEGKLAVEIRGIDKRLLNIVGSGSGADFGGTTINSTNLIELTHAGANITASGGLNLSNLQIARAGQRTPMLDLVAGYVVAVDIPANNAVIRRLDIVATQDHQPLFDTGLSAPLTLAWGNSASAVGDAALNLAITNLNLADWKAFLGDTAAGVVGARVKLTSQQAGKQLAFDATAKVGDLAVHSSQPMPPVDVELQAAGQALNLKQVALTNFVVRVARQNQQMLSVSGTANYDLATSAADAQIDVGAAIPLVVEMAPQSGAAFSAGSMTLHAHVTQKQGAADVSGQLALTGLTGKFGANELRDFNTTVDVDVEQSGQLAQIRKASGKLTLAGKPGGSFDASGQFDTGKQAGKITATLAGLNENTLRPFLASALGDKTLSSIAINATVNSQYDAHADSSVTADLHVSNLVVLDPKNQIPATPLEARVQVDASLRQQVADVRQLELTLTPTDRARNDLKLTGKLDLSKPGAFSGDLKLAADSLDFTRYYDIFTAGTNAPAPKTAAAPTAPAAKPAPVPETEPAPVTLPLSNFTFDASIGQLYLREVAATNFQATIKIDGSHVVVNPLQVVLNGAPIKITADTDLSVPGYRYTTAIDGDDIAFAPLVDTFAPDRKGQLGGSLRAHIHVTGAGITGPNLQKNLAGQVDIATTNLDLSVVNIQSPVLKGIVDVVAGIGALIRNPAAGGASFLGTATGSQSGIMEDLQKSPIEVVAALAAVSNGRVDLKSVNIRSAAFAADVTNGVSLLAPNLMDSTLNVPVSISLAPALARKTGLAAATSTNTDYVKLPQFLTMTGTYAAPKKHIESAALVKAALKGATGGASGLLHGLENAIHPAGSTNAPPSTNNPVNNLLHNLFKR